MNVQVKICGLTNYEDAALAVTLGAGYLGFIFAESPRKVTSETVTDILTSLSAKRINLMSDQPKISNQWLKNFPPEEALFFRGTSVDRIN